MVSRRRVVITGAGCVSPYGRGIERYWQALSRGESGVSRIDLFDPTPLKARIAGQVRGYDPWNCIDPKDRRHVSRTVALAIAASEEALSNASIHAERLSLEQRRRFGVFLGTGGGPLEFTERQYQHYYTGQTRNSVYSVPSSTPGTLSSELSQRFQLHGPSHVLSTGCTSSTDALGYAMMQIMLGKIDIALAGGADAPLAPGIISGFEMMNVVTTRWNHDPARASRPFSGDRDGMVLAEGAWFFVLESLENALSRGSKVLAEILGYGSTCDAHHRVRLDESGLEPARAMSLALEDAGLEPAQIGYVNLHGTSTLLNDRIETRAIKKCFGESAYDIAMSSTKSLIGHPQGASGAAGVAAALLALARSIVHPTLNLETADPECDLDYVAVKPRVQRVDYALCNCIGFGSKNSALVLSRGV